MCSVFNITKQFRFSFMRYLTGNRITKSGGSSSDGGNTNPPSETGTIQLTNKSGNILEYGDIVVLDKTNPLSVTATNIYYNEDVIGVVKIGGAANELVTIQYTGIIDAKMTVFPVNIGDKIFTGDVFGRGYASSFLWPGAFAKALTSKPNGVTGLVKIMLILGMPKLS